MLHSLLNDIELASDKEKAVFLQRFFKTGKGQYGEGDVFAGLVVPTSRKLAKKYQNLSFAEIETLLTSKVHEERLIALLILVIQFEKGAEKTQKTIYAFYLKHAKKINNWDLVDLSADKIVGKYLTEHRSEINTLTTFAQSTDIWEKRIAMLSTFAFIKIGESEQTYNIADILLHDPSANSGQMHDLIQKAVGWMLREAGKRVSNDDLEAFLKTRYKTMPRTMLRYAIERFPAERRKEYLQGLV